MSATLRKRCREPEALPDTSDVRESKRSFNGIGEETDLFRHLPLLDKTVAENQEVNEECASRKDYVVGVMRSMEEEISATFSTFCEPISGDNSSSYDIYSVHEGEALVSDSGIDLCYLLDASDDELGIPSYPVLDSKDEVSEPSEETFTTEGLSETPNLKWQGENWDFVDEFPNYQQFDLLEDSWDANHAQDCMNKDLLSQNMLFEGDFSAAWALETTGCM